MRFPVELRLQPSRILMASVLVAHVAAALALFHVPALHAFAAGDEVSLARSLGAVLAWAALALSALRALRAEQAKDGLILWLEEDGLVEVFAAGAEQGVLCRIRPHSAVVLPRAVWFSLQVLENISGATAVRARVPAGMMLLASNVQQRDFQEPHDGDDWRRLRIWLRHRADRAADAADQPG
ncbi:hypothetical protein CKCBHOJB_01856 [Thauera sp. GDN1]|nr:hypothetical protein CKCBHOJB_01856 [Thauera sp. GDN1]